MILIEINLKVEYVGIKYGSPVQFEKHRQQVVY
jgi:hypothetical protein